MESSATARHELFVQAVGQHYPGLVRRLTVVVDDRETAIELAQEAYLRAYRSWDRFDGTDARAWLHTIGLRLAFNERDRRRRWRGLLGRRVQEEPATGPVDHELREALGELRRWTPRAHHQPRSASPRLVATGWWSTQRSKGRP